VLDNILPKLKTVWPNVVRRQGFGRQAVIVGEGCVDPTEPLRDEGPFGDHTGYYTLPSPRGIASDPRLEAADRGIPRGEPYPVLHVTAITHRKDAVYPATIVGTPPMEDFYIGGAALTRPAATLSHRMGEGLGDEGAR